jgi:hypothetical protein
MSWRVKRPKSWRAAAPSRAWSPLTNSAKASDKGRKSRALAALARFFADSRGDADFFFGGTVTGGEPAKTGSFVGHTEL